MSSIEYNPSLPDGTANPFLPPLNTDKLAAQMDQQAKVQAALQMFPAAHQMAKDAADKTVTGFYSKVDKWGNLKDDNVIKVDMQGNVKGGK